MQSSMNIDDLLELSEYAHAAVL